MEFIIHQPLAVRVPLELCPLQLMNECLAIKLLIVRGEFPFSIDGVLHENR
jgi:hypothetical protein